jgi:hypothetical protein
MHLNHEFLSLRAKSSQTHGAKPDWEGTIYLLDGLLQSDLQHLVFHLLALYRRLIVV